MAKRKQSTRATSDYKAAYRAIGWVVLAGVWLLLTAAMVSHHPADPPADAFGVHNEPIRNWVGQFGALLSHKLHTVIGPGIWVLLAGAAAYLIATGVGRKVGQLPLRIVGLILMAITASALVGVGLPTMVANYPVAPHGAGGLLSLYLNDQLEDRFAVAGTMVILGVAFWIGALLAVDELMLALPRALGRLVLGVRSVKVPMPAMGPMAALADRLPRPWRTGGEEKPPARRQRRRGKDDELIIDEDAGGLGATESFGMEADAASAVRPDDQEEDEYEYEEDEAEGEAACPGAAAVEDEDEEEADDEDAADAPGAYLAHKKGFDPEELRAKMRKMPINFAPRANTHKAPAPREPDLSGYQFPGLDLLEAPESNFTKEMEEIVRQQAVDLESALQQYKIQGEVVGIDSGPVITLFEVRLAPGTKVSQIGAIDSDLARALKAQNIRIVPNMAGKDTIGIEVPNLKKEKVRMRELMAADPTAAEKMRLPMFLGKDASGNPLIQDLAAMPHMLIAGTTGSGKSVCMNSIIMSFLFTRRPDELKLVLVDPKMVEMSMFKDIPHLMCPVVTEMGKASAILEWAVTKMDERYELLAEAGVRDIGSYNGLGWEELKERMSPATEDEEARIPKKLPYMVFVIDELADLMMTNKEVESFIVRIAQKARAVGIHLILATQRPQANVVTGLIKSNMPSRVAFKVASGMDSRIVLDQKGGELLLGHGDMLFLSPRSSKLIRAQGTLVDDAEIRKTVKFLREISQQHFEPQLVQIKGVNQANGDGGGASAAERDPLFEDAVQVVLETQRGSVSLLQRRLTIGYARASRLIEEMGQAGIIGEYKGSQAREVMVSPEEWEALKAQAEADAASADAEGTLYASDDDEGSVPDEIDGEYRQ